MSKSEEGLLSPQISETITNPESRMRAVVALRHAGEWQEALQRGDMLEADAQFEKLKHTWSLMASEYEAEQKGEVARQYTCVRCGTIYS